MRSPPYSSDFYTAAEFGFTDKLSKFIGRHDMAHADCFVTVLRLHLTEATVDEVDNQVAQFFKNIELKVPDVA